MIINHKSGKGGVVGKDGTTPHIGANGNWFLGETDTGVAAQGKSDTRIETIMLPVADWDSDTLSQVITCTGVLEDETKQIITTVALPGNEEVCETCHIVCSAFAKDTLTFTAATLPSVDVYIYVILESVSGGANTSSDVYSAEETVVGTWIDGKPVYRRLIFVTIASTGKNVVLRTSNTLMDACCRLDAIMQNNASGNIKTPASFNEFMRLYESMDGNLYLDIINSAAIGHTCMVVLEYTKLSDTATIDIPSATALMEAYEEGVNEA